ncbi:hypothetical protein PbJCM13498_28280 [Prolixibacter bellariivorans]|uniref:Nitroreductase domain-containing protein n=1 Tax=Prolixibacter bellariivorans TaxID=314319 RepID=A0A5M4B1D3_9BACT|nr:nitroreductase family protein [Prolixibacter bellariivorans]GET33965.1 hypothetical protein PbJCM13498_28280 [Prolixibacter bellariivorans]
MIKKALLQIVPNSIYIYLKDKKKFFLTQKILRKSYDYDYKKYLSHSDSFSPNTSTKMIGNIIKTYHTIEKGLTMPEFRPGFGQQKVIELCHNCINYIKKYGDNEEQLKYAVQVILEYKTFHNSLNFALQPETENEIQNIRNYAPALTASSQIETTDVLYFKNAESSFDEFSNSRASVRNFTGKDIPLSSLTESLKLAQNTPSACNRQCWRTYVYTQSEQINEILEEQGGNRGFGHLTNKLIVITAELGVFNRHYERNQAYIDGGLYAMNLLYSLHFQKIAACILNCSTWPEKDVELRKLCKIKDSEVFIAMVACGLPPQKFKIAASKRYKIDVTNRFIS